MRKQILRAVFCSLLLIPATGIHAQSTVQNGQSTEGKDFWVTFLQADHLDGDDKSIQLSLTFSSRETCDVTIANPYYVGEAVNVVIDGGAATNRTLPFTITINANQATEVQLYSGTAKSTNANNKFCYTRKGEVVDSSAVHVTSTQPISLYASNYKPASFDAANVLPVSALQKEYLIQNYTPSDHDKTPHPQGSHFAIVAVNNNTKVWYTPSVLTIKNRKGYEEYLENKDKTYVDNPFLSAADNEKARQEFEAKKAELIAQWENFKIGEHTDSVTLQAGQVYYVWTGDGEGYDYDLSGTKVTADQPVAVFQGNPHTNLPYYKDFGLSTAVKQRDHIFSQAMPLSTWGNTFAITRSSRKRDVLRIMAQEDGTEVRINGVLKHTFDFSSSDPKEHNHYWEVQIGEAITNGGEKGNDARPDADIPGGSCYIETSCPCAVHLFLVSQQWDGNKENDGDPAMLWVNPIEQRIDQITFSTFSSKNGTTYHYVNVVTDSASVLTDNKMLLNDTPLTGWQPIVGSDQNGDMKYKYYYVRHQLPSTEKNSKPLSYTLKRDKAQEGQGFIAYVYGFTENESYGYNAGGSTKELTQYITINGQIFTPDSKNSLCGDDTIKFACHPDYDYEKIEWYFGDGTSNLENKDSVPHEYKEAGVYNAYVLIYRNSSNVCVGQNAIDSIPITVTIGNYKVDVKGVDMPDCTIAGTEVDMTIYLNNESNVDLSGDSVKIDFNQIAKEDGLTNDRLSIVNDSTLVVHLTKDAKEGKDYGLHLHIGSECPNSVLDKDLTFSLKFSKKLLEQRYNNVLGLIKDSFPNQTLSDFVWYHDGEAVPDQTTSVLYLDETNPATEGEYKVCYTIHEEGQPDKDDCTCPTFFQTSEMTRSFGTPDQLVITATYAWKGEKVFVNADWNGETDIECYAQWINVSGDVVNGEKFNIPDGGCTIPVPSENGFYILRVVTDGAKRSFKFIINH